jgi:hypothetical protein
LFPVRLTKHLRWAIYALAAAIGVAGAAFGFSKGITLLIIAMVVIPIELTMRRS